MQSFWPEQNRLEVKIERLGLGSGLKKTGSGSARAQKYRLETSPRCKHFLIVCLLEKNKHHLDKQLQCDLFVTLEKIFALDLEDIQYERISVLV